MFRHADGSNDRQRFEHLLFLQNVAVSAAMVFLLLFVREAPEFPPSHTSLRVEKPINFTRVMDLLTKNSDFQVLLVIFATLLGVFQTFGNLMGTLFEPFGLTPGKISFYGALLLASGILAAPVIGAAVGKYKKYLLSLRTLICTMAIMFSGMLAFIQNLDVYEAAFTTSMVIVGACAVSLIPTCIDFAIETSFPVQP